jgi:hypothetical protein
MTTIVIATFLETLLVLPCSSLSKRRSQDDTSVDLLDLEDFLRAVEEDRDAKRTMVNGSSSRACACPLFLEDNRGT